MIIVIQPSLSRIHGKVRAEANDSRKSGAITPIHFRFLIKFRVRVFLLFEHCGNCKPICCFFI
ncbi:hypothetical protein V1264_009718 [Littorina saxatilis]|uniref:Uncharacterized protein n=1 Tax=Littorina saxatilis TaxID=31220 RepID=A0AAN9G1Q2_9CAEN